MWKLASILALAGTLPSQTLVLDRAQPGSAAAPLAIERGEGKGFLGDSFQVGAKGEVWTLDSIRVWAAPGAGASCPKTPGDLVEKVVLLGALDNPPVPGQPACACHALIRIAAADFQTGAAAPTDPNVKVASEEGLWRLDFGNLRWSVPGGMDILYAVRATPRSGVAPVCAVQKTWSLNAAPAAPAYRLFTFDKDALEDGFRTPDPPRRFQLQVWAHKSQ